MAVSNSHAGTALRLVRPTEAGPKGSGPHQTAKERWKADNPLTGKAMALASGVLFVAGTGVAFPKDDLSKAYDGRMLWAASAEDEAGRVGTSPFSLTRL